MLLGYVSDERYLALPGVFVEFERDDAVWTTQSTASGAIRLDIADGPVSVMLAKQGFGSKIVEVELKGDTPYQFRLLKDDILGYMWPKAVRSGGSAEFRVHSDEAFKAELWRYGILKERVRLIGWYDEHGPRATVQITPDGDYSRTGVAWNEKGYTNPHHKQFLTAPQRSGLYYLHLTTQSGRFFSFPWVVAPVEPTARVAVLASDINWNAYNNFGGRSNYIHPSGMPDRPSINVRLELDRYADPSYEHYKEDE